MDVVGGANDDSVKIVTIQKLTEIVVGFRSRIFLGGGAEIIIIDITKGDDVLAGHRLQVFAGPIGHADDAEVQLVICGKFSAVTLAPHQERAGSRERGLFKKIAACQHAARIIPSQSRVN